MSALSSATESDPSGKRVDLVMFMGQSNMAGRGTAKEAPVVPRGTGYEFRAISDPTTLYDIVEPFGVHENNAASGVSENRKTGSMVSAFAIEYFKGVGRPMVGVSCSKGGTSVNEWQPEGPFLQDAIERFTLAKHWLEENDYAIQRQFMVWCQGETDADHAMTATEYQAKLMAIIDAMIAVGLEKCYIVRIGNHRDDPTLYREIIRAQTDLCQTYAHAVLVSTKFAGMAAENLMSDQFHYTQTAYNIVGAEAGMNTALHIRTKQEPCVYDD